MISDWSEHFCKVYNGRNSNANEMRYKSLTMIWYNPKEGDTFIAYGPLLFQFIKRSKSNQNQRKRKIKVALGLHPLSGTYEERLITDLFYVLDNSH